MSGVPRNGTVTTTVTHFQRMKMRKPIVEKKRRDRMNHSIYQLEKLIARTIQHNTAPLTRIDKADILELTVFHLTQLQQTSTTIPTHLSAYRTGFNDCAREVERYLAENLDVSEFTVSCLNSHLHRVLVSQQMRQHSHEESTLPDQISTPLRPTDHGNSSLVEVGVSGYSSVQTYVHPTPAILGSGVPDMIHNSVLSFGSSVNNTNGLNDSKCFSFSNSNITNDANIFSCDISLPNYNSNYSTESGNNFELVEEKIEVGHVINGTIWRPW